MLAAVIHDENFVRQVKHQVALIGLPCQAQANGLELEGELIAECTIESEVGVVGSQGRADGAQHREYCWLLAAQLLGKPIIGRAYRSSDAVLRYIQGCQGIEISEGLADGCEQ